MVKILPILINIPNLTNYNNNLALFKAYLIFQSINNLNETKEVKEEVLNKIFEILDKQFKNKNI